MDARIERTRRALQGALLELAHERPFDELSVSLIAERAGVNRSSFYQHYGDRDELLADALDAAAAAAGADAPALELIPTGRPPAGMAHFLTHFADHAELYRRALGPRGSALVAARLRNRVAGLVREGVEHTHSHAFDDMPLELAAAGIAGSIVGVITAWLELDPLPDVDVAGEWVWRMVLGPGDTR
ncbi:TetR/AcrR family transcriptional regulator [Agromyces mediolanus]|uniref:TetR/AcrR family transcriptional regulator n=1 Tax=Agromyces mediolanus TaxID=41986 RepID=UPI00383560C1